MEFNDFGLLPPNDYELTLEELKNSDFSQRAKR